MHQHVCHGLVVADGTSEIAVNDAFPVEEVLFSERQVEGIGVANRGDVGGGSALAQHLLDGIARNEMDQEEDDADYQPNDWEGVEDALEDGFQFSVLGSRFSGFSSRFSVSFSIQTTRRRDGGASYVFNLRLG